MRPPSLGNIPVSIPLAHACRIDDKVRQIMGHLATRSLAIQGKTDKGKPKPLGITQMANAINGAVQSEIDREVGRLMKENRLVKEHSQQYALTACCTTSHDFFAQSTEPVTAVIIEIGVVYIACANFLEHLKAERPELYPLLRLVVNAMHSFGPVSTVDHLCDIIEDECSMMEDEAQDDKDRRYSRERKREAKRQRKIYTKHIAGANQPLAKVLRKMRSMHKKLACLMSEEENLFILTATQYLQAWDAWKADHAEFIEDDYDESHDITSFFYLIWDDSGPYYDYFESFMNGSGEMSAPHINLSIKDRRGIRTATQIVRALMLFETLMASIGDIWTK